MRAVDVHAVAELVVHAQAPAAVAAPAVALALARLEVLAEAEAGGDRDDRRGGRGGARRRLSATAAPETREGHEEREAPEAGERHRGPIRRARLIAYAWCSSASGNDSTGGPPRRRSIHEWVR